MPTGLNSDLKFIGLLYNQWKLYKGILYNQIILRCYNNEISKRVRHSKTKRINRMLTRVVGSLRKDQWSGSSEEREILPHW